MSEFNEHIPVMLEEVLSFVEPGRMTYVDLTLGRAGHARAILDKMLPGSRFYGVDRDQDALDYSRKVLGPYQDKADLHFLKSDFKNAPQRLKESGLAGADFILMDIGVSSPQFDDPSRGFSYRYDAPLDMRMDQTQKVTARDILNTADEKTLVHIFRDLGQCRFYFPVVRAIEKRRLEKPIETTFEFVDIIKDALPERELRKQGHPAKQFFLGLRYQVNGEIDQLTDGLKAACNFLLPKGRLVIISFNSEEDRIVKDTFKALVHEETGDKYHPVLDAKKSDFSLLTRKPLVPGEAELSTNNRAKASILRAIERR
jgi:16S rRNA (cytosine1402-N4)-methyltransferase